MRLQTLIAGALTASCALAQSTSPACISDCSKKNAFSSHCDGDETGAALDQCTCASWLGGGGDPMIRCIRACPASDQSVFASKLPELCRNDILPGVTASSAAPTSTPTNTSGGSQPSPTATGAQTTTTTPNAGAELAASKLLAAGGLAVALLL